MKALACCLGTATCLAPLTVAALQGVSHEPIRFDPLKGETVTIRYIQTSEGRVDLEIYDARDLMIRSVEGPQQPAGAHEVEWDGRDQSGRPVPPEAYSYALVETGSGGEQIRWDPADGAGADLELAGLVWDPVSGQMAYRLAKPGRVRIRVGLQDDGPLLATIVDWAAREAGAHREAWDGRDESGSLDLAKHPALTWTGEAFELPPNTVFAGSRTRYAAFIEDLPPSARRRDRERSGAHQMLDFARQDAQQRRDFQVSLALPPELPRTADGVPIVDAPVPVRLEVGEKALAHALNARSEAVFYVDGRFVFERETGFLPMTWVWDPAGHAPGLHHLTANIRGYEGHFGVGTTPVWVSGASEAQGDQE
ncbi:MAG: FlgD immunoglobulin-like domain containing protein [Myxococcota bacterium]